LLTVARALKFRPIGGLSFADALLPVLLDDARVHLAAIGPGGVVDWSAAQAQAPGRILALPESPETKTWFEAADIYVDSFPFCSNTSLLEAGLHGLPLVARRPFGAGCEIMGADSIGIDEHLTAPEDLSAFRDVARRLVADAGLRCALGEATRIGIEKTNLEPGFSAALIDLYDRILRLPPRNSMPAENEGPHFDAVDLYAPFVFGAPDVPGRNRTPEDRRNLAVEISLKAMPPFARLWNWARLWRGRRFVFRSRAQAWRYLVPEWVTALSRRMPAGRTRG
jgi:hypothetical protein